MAAPSYTTDLAIHDAATNANTFAEPTGMTDLDGAGVTDSDLAIYGSTCVSEAMRKTGLGALMASPAARTLPTDGGFFVWFKWFAPNSLAVKSSGGIRVLIGNSTGNYRGWYVDGSDTYDYGGWKNYVVDPRQTGLASQTQGSPTTTYQSVGAGVNCPTQTPSKGNAFTIDIIRYGRGQVIVTDGDLANGYATFAGIANVNDNETTGRWGLFQDAGGSYLWKGLLTLGQAGTAVDFRDVNVAITIDNTEYVSSTFNKIEIIDATSNIDWNAVSISSLSTQSRGNFEVVDNATVLLMGCTFTAMGTFTFLSNSTIEETQFRRTQTVTQNGATFTNCSFINNVAASSLVADTFANLTTCTFESDGSNHAIELTTVPANGSSITWAHTTTNYVSGSLGNFTTGTNTNATLYINPASANSNNFTIFVDTAEYAIPSIRFGANYNGTVTVAVIAKTIDVNVTDEDGNPLSGAFVWINDGTTTVYNSTTDINGDIPQQNYGGSNNNTLRVRIFGYKPFETTLGTATGSVSQLVTMVADRQQVAVPTLNQTWTINTTASTISVSGGSGSVVHTDYTTLDTSQDLYEFIMNTFAATSFMQFPHPIDSITQRQYEFVNGWTFGANDVDHKYLYGGSYLDSANSLLWSNIKTIGTVETGTSIYIVQGTENADAALTSWWPDGNIDILVKVQDGTFIQSTDDTATNVDGAVWLFAREYGDLYDHFFVDASAGGQNIVALSTLPDLNNDTASATVAGYTNITFTFGATSQDIGDGNGNQPYNVIVNCAGRTLKQVYEYTKYVTSFDFSQTVNGDDGYEYRNADEANFSGVDNKQAPFGTFAGGRFFGAQGVFLTNMASVDNTNYQLIDSNGVPRFPPQTVTFELTGLKNGTEIRIYDTATSTLIAGVEDMTDGIATSATTGVTITGSADNNTFAYTYTYSADENIFVVIIALGWQVLRLSDLVLGNTSQSIPVSQVIDRPYNNP